MKLLIIVLCLLSERFLVHVVSHNRFYWFKAYGKLIENHFPKNFFLSSWITLALIVLPWLLITGVVLYFFDNLLYGAVGFFLNIAIFYCCIGPGNPFYPARATVESTVTNRKIGEYLVQINGELFAVLFWYIILGPLGIVAYRLISLSQNQKRISRQAFLLTSVLDWLPVRMTSLLYLLVGDFQAGFAPYSRLFFSRPNKNEWLLSECGLTAMGREKGQPVLLAQAENLVEHAVIAFLVLLAVFTLVSECNHALLSFNI